MSNEPQASNTAPPQMDSPTTVSDLQGASEAFSRMNQANEDLVNDLSSPIYSIPVTMRVIIGTMRLPISRLLSLEIGSNIELEQRIGDPVDIVVNDRVIARGELSVSEGDNPNLFVTITELVSNSLTR